MRGREAEQQRAQRLDEISARLAALKLGNSGDER